MKKLILMIILTFASFVICNAAILAVGMESVNVQDLKDIPCILVASQSQRENEQSYYRDIVGISGDFLFAENLEEARLLVIGGKGFMPVEGRGNIQPLII